MRTLHREVIVDKILTQIRLTSNALQNPPHSPSTLLITGASGFVGQALRARLNAEGAAFKTASRSPRADSIAVGDIDGRTDWSAALAGVDTVVHLAARVHVMRDNAADPLTEFRKVNVEGTLNLARQALAAGVRRFIYISSIKVNGEQTTPGRPFHADDAPAPEDAYGISKREAEDGIRALCDNTPMEYVIIRPPLVYGPGVKGNFAGMMRWLAKGVPLPLAAVDNRRSLVAVDNLVDLIQTGIAHPAAANRIFLVSDGDDLSTPDLLRRTAAALGTRARLLPIPTSCLHFAAHCVGKSAAAQKLCGSLQVDIQKNRQLLGWQPPVAVDQALRAAAQRYLETAKCS